MLCLQSQQPLTFVSPLCGGETECLYNTFKSTVTSSRSQPMLTLQSLNPHSPLCVSHWQERAHPRVLGTLVRPVETVGSFSLLKGGKTLGLTALPSGTSTRRCSHCSSFHREVTDSSCGSNWEDKHPSQRWYLLWPENIHLAWSVETDWPNVEGWSKKEPTGKRLLAHWIGVPKIFHIRQQSTKNRSFCLILPDLNMPWRLTQDHHLSWGN